MTGNNWKGNNTSRLFRSDQCVKRILWASIDENSINHVFHDGHQGERDALQIIRAHRAIELPGDDGGWGGGPDIGE